MATLNWAERTTEIPEDGLKNKKVATAEECQEVASALGVSHCHKLVCTYAVRPLLGDRFQLKGHIFAELTQPCVVTLDPVKQALEVDVGVEFWPEVQINTLSEEFDEPDREDPEPIVGGELQVGHIVYELIASNIDPYPRAPGAELERSSSETREAAQSHPFAALSALKEDDDRT